MFIHVSSHYFQGAKFRFFSLCKTANFGMSVAQKSAGKSHTSPSKKLAEKKEISDSSTTFTCRVSVATVDKNVILPVIKGWVP